MTEKDLIGEKVISQHYGEGVIIKIEENKVEIAFASKTTYFHLQAFGMSLKACRPQVQEYILGKCRCHISFDLGEYAAEGEIPPASQTVYVGQMIKLPSGPKELEHYTFQGWSDGISTYEANSSYVAKENTVFKAIWKMVPLRPSRYRRVFYVFQGMTYERELSEGFIFAPYSPYNRWIHHWERMTEVRAGDLILHGAHGEVVAISEAKGSAYNFPMPSFAGEWRHHGNSARRVDINACWPIYSIRTSNHRDKIIEYCSGEEYPPFNRNGTGNQGYLYNCPNRLADYFIRILVQINPKLGNVSFIKEYFQQQDE